MTGIFEIVSGQKKLKYSGTNVPIEDYKRLLKLFKLKLEVLYTENNLPDQSKPKPTKKGPSHRIEVLANWYKSDAKIEKRKTATDLRNDGGQSRYDAYRELSGLGRKILPARRDEIEFLISYLAEFPTAVTLVQRDLDEGNHRKTKK